MNTITFPPPSSFLTGVEVFFSRGSVLNHGSAVSHAYQLCLRLNTDGTAGILIEAARVTPY